ncbi:hypothetical protein ACFSQJ_10935 [Croceitalea marina]|uniref:CdiI C-terminal domain-containing protein n=1 Tax=Croceitalea marina TaxID=1775166 RepID=A0ABW5MWE3_9FLAO
MSAVFQTYKSRKITFDTCMNINDWTIKVYIITNRSEFESNGILKNSKNHLPVWLKRIENSTLPTYKHAFLIVHEAREGVWILLNWWTGGEMIETKVFFTSFDSAEIITDSPYNTNSLLCVWELEVFAHERSSWIEHILSKPNNPDYLAYTSDTLCEKV